MPKAGRRAGNGPRISRGVVAGQRDYVAAEVSSLTSVCALEPRGACTDHAPTLRSLKRLRLLSARGMLLLCVGSGSSAASAERAGILQVLTTLTATQSRSNSSWPKYQQEMLAANMHYAWRHGYDWTLHTRAHQDFASYHPSWQRIPYILEAFEAGVGLVLYLDADVEVINPALELPDLLNHHRCGSAELLLSMDSPVDASSPPHGNCCRGNCSCLLNNAVILARRTAWVSALLRGVLQSHACAPYIRERQWEQDCLQLHLQSMGELPEIGRVPLSAAARPRSWGTEPVLSPSGHICFMPKNALAPWNLAELRMLSRGQDLPLAMHLLNEPWNAKYGHATTTEAKAQRVHNWLQHGRGQRPVLPKIPHVHAQISKS